MALKGSGKGGSMEIKVEVKIVGVSKPKKWTAREKPTELQEKLDEGKKSGVFTFTSTQGKLVDVFLGRVQYMERETGIGEAEKKEKFPPSKETYDEKAEVKKPASKEELGKEAQEKKQEKTKQ